MVILFFCYLLFEKEPMLPFLMLSAKQENLWFHY